MGFVDTELTRRRLIELGIALPAAVAAARYLSEAAVAATPACDDGDETPEETEGPFFTPRSPLRRNLVTPGMAGTRLTITGFVLTTACKPVKRALVDFWQCDAAGRYDNVGYRLRGHQFTDAKGAWKLDTIVPALYSGRTKHIHVKVQAPGQPVLTTQLFFPGVPQNREDGIFDSRLLLKNWRLANGRRQGRFDFHLAV
jgi:protocatechuate 3,4-dioxygenase beta subunit